MKAIVTVGCSGSGKSTFAEELSKRENYSIVERDQHRKNMQLVLSGGIQNPNANFWSTWNWKLEKDITESVRESIQFLAKMGKDIIVSDTNLNKKFREEMVSFLESLGYEVEIKIFFLEYAKLLERDNKRKDSVGQQVIAHQYDTFMEQYGASEFGIVKHVHTGQPKAAIFDVDGTLALHTSTRKPYDWSRVKEDSICKPTRAILNSLREQDYTIIILSGRDSVCKNETKEWLDENNVDWDSIYMRAEGDMRPDWIVKNELFQNHVANNYDVEMWFDDRPVVVRLANLLGIRCYAVGNQHKEF